ncbi:hypothetical protein ACEPAI_4069 [Sanghuangporus weigelae]
MCSSRRFLYPLSVTSLLLIFPTLIRSQASNQTVLAPDSSIDYVGSGWTESSGHMFTNDAASFSLDFTGSAIYWYSRKLYDGATTTVTLDGSSATLDLSDGMSQNSPRVEAVVFSRSGLDASQSHRFTVASEGPGSNGIGTVLENWQIVYTVGTTSSPTTTTTSSPRPATIPSSNPLPATSPSSEANSSPTPAPSPIVSTTSQLITSVRSGSTFVSTSASIVTFTIFTSSSASSGPDFARTSSFTVFDSTSTITESAATAPQLSSPSNLSAIIGGTVGGTLAIIVIVIALLCFRRRRRIAVQRNSQSASFFNDRASEATPFFTTQNRINGSTVDYLHPPSSKHPRHGATGESSSLSPTSIARGWKWARSGTFPDNVPRSPQDATFSSIDPTSVAQEYEMSNRPSAAILIPVPLSPGEARQSSIIDDPPPVYRR